MMNFAGIGLGFFRAFICDVFLTMLLQFANVGRGDLAPTVNIPLKRCLRMPGEETSPLRQGSPTLLVVSVRYFGFRRLLRCLR